MTSYHKINDEKLPYYINKKTAKILALSLKILISMNILQVKQQNKLSLYILVEENLKKHGQKQLRIKPKGK